MALYDLVYLKSELEKVMCDDTLTAPLQQLRDRLIHLQQEVPEMSPEHREYLNGVIAHYEHVIELATQPMTDMTDMPEFIKTVNQNIRHIVHELFTNNYELEKTPSLEYIRHNRKILVGADVEQAIKQKILLYTDWRYPALEIGCRDGEWTKYLVAADPLYVVDQHGEFLDSTCQTFTPEYQRRLRCYCVRDHDLSELPEHQFSFVFSWGMFNYLSMESTKSYLTQVFQLLRPGGVFMFSYNDGDTPAGASMAERFAQTYLPKSFLTALSQSLGFDIVNAVDMGPNVSWLEIKKPGELSTVKAHQVLGEIMPREI